MDVGRGNLTKSVKMRAFSVLLVALLGCVAVHGGVLNQKIQGRAGACTLAVTGGLGEPQPLLITPGTTNFKRTEDTKGTLSFAANEAVLLACPGSGNYLTVRGSVKGEMASDYSPGSIILRDKN